MSRTKRRYASSSSAIGWSADGNACSLLLYENPFAEFVELPPQYATLSYSNLLCGAIRGARARDRADINQRQRRAAPRLGTKAAVAVGRVD